MGLWLALAAMTAVASLVLLGPLWRRRERGNASDVAVYTDMLGELERDKASGSMPAAEAESARVEIARRLLRAERDSAVPEGRAVGVRKLLVVIALLGVPALALGLYARLGAPQLPDLPLAARTPAPPVEDMIAMVETRLAASPDDVRGWEVIAPVYFRMGRSADAANAMRNIIRLSGETPARQQALAEALTMAANGMVTPEARTLFEKAAAAEPDAIAPRMYLALALSQDGRKDDAIAAWEALVARAKGGEEWLEIARGQIDQLKGIARPPEAPAEPSADQQAMIEGMVSGLASRLAANGGTLEEWTRLVRSYMVLKKPDEARKALAAATENLKGDAAARSGLTELAASLGLTP